MPRLSQQRTRTQLHFSLTGLIKGVGAVTAIIGVAMCALLILTAKQEGRFETTWDTQSIVYGIALGVSGLLSGLFWWAFARGLEHLHSIRESIQAVQENTAESASE